MAISIIFEDDSMLIINKPPGMVVNRAQSVKEETIQDWIEKLYPNNSSPSNPSNPSTPSIPSLPPSSPIDYSSPEQIQKEFLSRSGIVHRIDKETSGILLIAKNPEAFFALKQQFMNHVVEKTYLAIVHEKLPSLEGEINAPIDRLP
jgi:23S rRNA pseudouridine1911/1915/1917 synthase